MINLLYIENNEFNQRLVGKVLKPKGFSVHSAWDGLQGIRVAMDTRPDIILLDLELPYLDGFGTVAKIKSVSSLKDVPVIAMVAANDRMDQERALVAGCDGTIDKPINVKSFAKDLHVYIAGKREQHDGDDHNQILKDHHVALVDQLQEKITELEHANTTLAERKVELERAYQKSQEANVELKRLGKLKENILAISSHELRTPLSIALGYVDVLMQGVAGDLSSPQSQYLQTAHQSMVKMSVLVDRICDLSQITNKKRQKKMEKVELISSLVSSHHDISFFGGLRDVHFELSLCEPPLMVPLNAELIDQVIGSLLTNALCYTPDGGTVTTKVWSEHGKAFLSVTDTGIGIDPNDLERVFEEFYQAHDPLHHKTGKFEFMARGIGLGLSICKGILEEVGGKIWASSQGNSKGSTFTFYLPLVGQ